MADVKKTVEIIFSAVDRTSGAIQSSTDAIQAFSAGVGSVTGPLSSLTSTLIQAELAIGALAVGLGAVAFNESVEFESALLDLGKVLKDGEGDLVDYGNAMVDLALEFGVSSSELVQSQANFVQAGFSASEAADLVRDSLNLVIAGEIEASQASELLIASLKGFREPASEAARLTDILNEVSNNYATNVEELAIGMAGIAPIANQMGFSFEETAGILTPVIEVFRSGSQAAIALKTGLLRLVDDSQPVQDALAAIGVAQRDANGDLRSGKDILDDVASAFVHLDDNQKVFLTSQLVGIDQAARLVQVFDNLSQSTDITATALDSAGSATREVEIRMASAQVQINRAKSAFAELATALGDQFRVELTGVISAMGLLADSFRGVVNDGGLDPLFDLLRPKLREFEETLITIAENLPAAFEGVDFSRLADALGEVGTELNELFDVDLTTTEGLQDAIQKIVDSIAVLTEFTANAIEGIGPLVEKAQEFLNAILELDPSVIALAGNIGGLASGVNLLLPSIDTALLAFLALGGANGAIPKLATTAASLPAGLSAVGGAFSSLIALMTGPAGLVVAAGAAGGALGSVVNNVLSGNDAFIDTADNVFGFVDSLFGIERGAQKAGIEVATAATDLSQFKDNVKDAGSESDATAKSTEELAEELKNTGSISNVTADQLDAATAASESLAKEQEVAANALERSGEAIERSSEGLSDYEAAVQGLIPATQEVADQWVRSELALQDLTQAQEGVNVTMEDGVTVYTQVAKAQDAAGDSLEELAAAGEIAKDKYAELVVELQKAEIEAQVKLDIAQVEANADIVKAELETFKEVTELQLEFDIAKVKEDTERVKALITGITDAAEIVSSNIQHVIDAIAGLDAADDLAEAKFEIFQRQLELENERLDKQLENQTRLTDAQIKELEARTNRLRSGEAVIKIDGGNLQPELEAFMFRILSAIQVRANADAQSFLLGIAG